MFTFILTLLVLALSVLALPQGSTSPCSAGPIQCCDQMFSYDSHNGTFLINMLNIDVARLPAGNIAMRCLCFPSFLVSSTKDSMPLCCSGKPFNGPVNIGCISVPVDISL
ncbi:hypothetical protein B0H21DRAFT_750770 [Amylocystis lapponica]|nr:hypothetical protein B0H21DRAFT_750770 [Amylocystis lapponica]